MKSEAKYSIQMASKLTGVGIHTLRKWESRYNLISPERDEGGRRIYNEEEIEKLQLLNELTTLGESIGHLKERNTEELKEMANKIMRETQRKDINLDGPKTDPKEVLYNLLLALQHYKLEIISHELEKLNLMLNRKEMALSIFLPLLREVGKRVFQGTLSMTQELAIQSIVRIYLAKIINQNLSNKSKSLHNVIVASPEGETNDFQLLITCLLLEHYQVKFYYLGTNIPAEAIAEAAKALNSTELIIGVSSNHYEHNKKFSEGQIMTLSKAMGETQIIRLGLKAQETQGNIQDLSNLTDLDKVLSQW